MWCRYIRFIRTYIFAIMITVQKKNSLPLSLFFTDLIICTSESAANTSLYKTVSWDVHLLTMVPAGGDATETETWTHGCGSISMKELLRRPRPSVSCGRQQCSTQEKTRPTWTRSHRHRHHDTTKEKATLEKLQRDQTALQKGVYILFLLLLATS